MLVVYVRLGIALVLLPIIIWVLHELWWLLEFFHQELLLQLLMGLGDTREPSLGERLQLNLVRIPFFVFALGVAGFYFAIIRSSMRRITQLRP